MWLLRCSEFLSMLICKRSFFLLVFTKLLGTGEVVDKVFLLA